MNRFDFPSSFQGVLDKLPALLFVAKETNQGSENLFEVIFLPIITAEGVQSNSNKRHRIPVADLYVTPSNVGRVATFFCEENIRRTTCSSLNWNKKWNLFESQPSWTSSQPSTAFWNNIHPSLMMMKVNPVFQIYSIPNFYANCDHDNAKLAFSAKSPHKTIQPSTVVSASVCSHCV